MSYECSVAKHTHKHTIDQKTREEKKIQFPSDAEFDVGPRRLLQCVSLSFIGTASCCVCARQDLADDEGKTK